MPSFTAFAVAPGATNSTMLPLGLFCARRDQSLAPISVKRKPVDVFVNEKISLPQKML